MREDRGSNVSLMFLVLQDVEWEAHCSKAGVVMVGGLLLSPDVWSMGTLEMRNHQSMEQKTTTTQLLSPHLKYCINKQLP